MSHITRMRKDEDDIFYSRRKKEDLFYCENCNLDFALDSEKIKNIEYIVCPVCLKNLKAFGKNWG